MKRTVFALALIALAGCSTESDLPENPPYAVPGQTVQQPPPGQPIVPMIGAIEGPPLRVPGRAEAIVPPPPMPPGMPPGQMPPGMQPGQVPPPGMQPGQVPPMQPGQVPPPGMQPQGAPLTLTPGFQPAIQRLTGNAGGDSPAQQVLTTQDPSCESGLIFAQPSQIVTLTADFQYLRVLAVGPEDPFLAIRGSDGSVRCNDDALSTRNPMIEGPFRAGTYQIWVGVWRDARTPGPYVLGITQYPGADHAALR